MVVTGASGRKFTSIPEAPIPCHFRCLQQILSGVCEFHVVRDCDKVKMLTQGPQELHFATTSREAFFVIERRSPVRFQSRLSGSECGGQRGGTLPSACEANPGPPTDLEK